MPGPLFVFVDWNRNGSFADATDDVTDRVRGALTCQYGRDQSTALSPVVAGRGGFVLDNTSRDYSPRNSGSPLFGLVKPARPVLVQRQVSATTYTIFRGHTDDSPINPDVDSKTVGFSLIDTLGDFRGVKVTTTLSSGITTGAAINLVLTAAGWTGGRQIDTGSTLIPWFWADGADAFDLLQQLVASEGPPALLTIDSTGAVVFRDRQHRLTSTASTTVQATFAGSGSTEPILGPGFVYSEPWGNIINDVQFDNAERKPTGQLVAVWQSDDTISIAASSSYVLVLSTSDPFFGAVTPVQGTDYLVDTGSITGVTLSRTSGGSTSVTFTAGAGGAQISAVQLRAFSVPVARTRKVTASDSTSQTAYGVRTLPSGAEPVWASYPDAVSLAQLHVARSKDPLTQITARFTCQDTQTARLTAVLTRNLSDRVTVNEAETVTNGPFFVESISHEVRSVAEHVVEFGLEAVPAAPASGFIIGTSTLNGATPLGY